nr:MAG TPA: hypothetical protein [Caudoviricetes sp.]
MKIFYKKDFYGVLEEKNNLEKEYKEYKSRKESVINTLNKRCAEQFKQINSLNTENESLKKNNDILKNKFIKQSTSKDGITKENHKLKTKIEELNNIIKQQEEKLSKRYILKKISPGRTPNTIKTSIRSSANESRAIKYVKENL